MKFAHSTILEISLALGACAIGVGCNGGTTTDAAVDGGTDIATDNGQVDTGVDVASDIGTDVAIDAGSDASADAATDAGSDTAADAAVDPRTFDPMHYYYYRQTGRLGRLDTRGIGGAQSETSPFVLMTPMTSPTDVIAPDDTAGGCIYHAQRLTGDMTRNTLDDVNYGDITFTQPSGNTVTCSWVFDPAGSGYGCDSSMATLLDVAVPTTLTIAGVDGGMGAMSTVDFPPLLAATAVHLPTSFSRTTDSTVSWDVPTGATADLAAAVVLFDNNRANVTVCVVPATMGHLTMPHQLVNHYTAGDAAMTQVNAAVSLERIRFVPIGSLVIDYRVESGIVNLVPVI